MLIIFTAGCSFAALFGLAYAQCGSVVVCDQHIYLPVLAQAPSPTPTPTAEPTPAPTPDPFVERCGSDPLRQIPLQNPSFEEDGGWWTGGDFTDGATFSEVRAFTGQRSALLSGHRWPDSFILLWSSGHPVGDFEDGVLRYRLWVDSDEQPPEFDQVYWEVTECRTPRRCEERNRDGIAGWIYEIDATWAGSWHPMSHTFDSLLRDWDYLGVSFGLSNDRVQQTDIFIDDVELWVCP